MTGRSPLVKQKVAGRIQQIVKEDGRSLTGFRKTLREDGQAGLASAIRGWLPPQGFWEWEAARGRWLPKPNPRTGKSQSKRANALDWEAVKTPRSDLLREFCEFADASADWILFGDVPRRRHDRTSIGRLAEAVRQRSSEKLEQFLPSTARDSFLPSGKEYLKLLEVADLEQYAECSLALTRAALNHVVWLSHRVSVLSHILPNPKKARAPFERVIEEVAASLREVIFRQTEGTRSGPVMLPPSPLSMRDLEGLVDGGLSTIGWLACFDLDRLRDPEEAISSAQEYEQVARALRTLPSPLYMEGFDPKHAGASRRDATKHS